MSSVLGLVRGSLRRCRGFTSRSCPFNRLSLSTGDGTATEGMNAVDGGNEILHFKERDEYAQADRTEQVPTTMKEILESPRLKAILRQHTDADERGLEELGRIGLEPAQLRIDVMAHLARDYDVFVPSNVFPTIRTIEQAAEFALQQVTPPESRYMSMKKSAPSNLFLNVKSHRSRKGVVTDLPRTAGV